MLNRLHRFLTAPIGKTSRATLIFWFCLSLICGLAIALLTVRLAFSGEYVVQDDARQHVFWMQRFLDPSLFPNDVIADYFQSVAPMGYTLLYRGLAAVGIEPLLASKLIPVPLALITTAFCFGACLQILPVPLAGFLASLLLNVNLSMADDLYSATPRAFVYPLFTAFLYFLLRRSRLLCAIATALLGLFYPQVMFVACGVLLLSLLRWQGNRPHLSTARSDYLLVGAGLAGAAIAVLLYVGQQDAAQFGPAISAAEARELPEFNGGRINFFAHPRFKFWVTAERSGILPRWENLRTPQILLAGLLLPVLLRWPRRFPLIQQVTAGVRSLGWTLVASIGLFGLAHLVLFKLHLPSRYTQHTFRIGLALAAGIVLTVLLDALLQWALSARLPRWQQVVVAGTLGMLAIGLVRLPIEYSPKPGYAVGKAPALYQFFAQQPKDVMIASLSTQADYLPTFAQRSVLAAYEYGIVYRQGYYEQFRQRMMATIQAQYSPDLAAVRQVIEQYGIDFWLLDNDAFQLRYFKRKKWMKHQYRSADKAAKNTLKAGDTPVLKAAIGRCQVLQTKEHTVLNADCVTRQDRQIAVPN